MKNAFKITMFITVFALFSCSSEPAPSHLFTDEGLAKVKEIITEKFGGDLEVYQININSQDDLNSYLGYVSVKYLKDGKIYSRTYQEAKPNIEAKLEDEELDSEGFQKKFFIDKARGKLKISDLDIEFVANNLLKAKTIVDDEFEYIYLKSYTIDVDPKSNKLSSRFKIQGTKKNSTKTQGRRVTTDYYDVEFEADSEGNVEVKE